MAPARAAESGTPAEGRRARIRRRLSLLPFVGEASQPRGIAAVADVGQCPIERLDCVWRNRWRATAERHVRRAQQRHRRRSRRTRADERQHQVEGRGAGLRRERQRVVALERHARGLEHAACHVHIGKRARDDDGGAIEPDGARRLATACLDAPHDGRNLVFAIAARVKERIALGRHDEHAFVERHVYGRCAQLVDAGQPIVDTRVKARRELGVGGDDVDAIDASARTSRSKSAGHSPPGSATRSPTATMTRAYVELDAGIDEPRAKRVLVQATCVRHAPLVGAERGRKEQGLAQHALRTPVGGRARLELAGQQAFEVVDAALMAPQLVVQLEHLAEERRAQVERRQDAIGDRLVRTGL